MLQLVPSHAPYPNSPSFACWAPHSCTGEGESTEWPCGWESYLGSLARSSPCSTWQCAWPWSSSYGSHPFAAHRTRRCTSESLPACHMCQHRERRGRTQENECCVFGVFCFFPPSLNCNFWCNWIKMWCVKSVGTRPLPPLIPGMLSTIPESAGAALESAKALLQWMLYETNKHPPAPRCLSRDRFIT